MKNLLKYFLFVLAVVALASCRDDDKVKVDLDRFEKGALPHFTADVTNFDGFIDILNIAGTEVNFTLDLADTSSTSGRDNPNLEFSDVESVDILLTFINTSEGTQTTVVYGSTTTWPITVTATAQELIGAFDASVVTIDSLDPGDIFAFNADLFMADGRKLAAFIEVNGQIQPGYSPSVLTNQNRVFLNYPVNCSSFLAGAYRLDAISGSGGLATQNVNIVELSPGYYQIDDATMDIFGNFPIRYNFNDVCNTIIMDPGSVDFGTQVAMSDAGGSSVDAATGVIRFNLQYDAVSCCGLAGLTIEFTATPL